MTTLTLRQPAATIGINGRRDRVQITRFAQGLYRPEAAQLRVYRRPTASSLRRLERLMSRPGVVVYEQEGRALRAVIG